MKGSAITKTTTYASGFAYLILPDETSETGYKSYMLNLTAVFSLFLLASNYTAADILTKIKTVDGAASGLDADLLDGNHASAFAVSGHNHDSVYSQINPRVQSVTSAATVTPNIDSYDAVDITAQAEALTIANPTGTVANKRKLLIDLKDNGTARAINWGNAYIAGGTALPSTTVLGKQMSMVVIYDSTSAKWKLRSLAQE